MTGPQKTYPKHLLSRYLDVWGMYLVKFDVLLLQDTNRSTRVGYVGYHDQVTLRMHKIEVSFLRNVGFECTNNINYPYAWMIRTNRNLVLEQG